MCGLAGFLGADAGDENTLTRMIATLHHRGPDNQGIWCDSSVGIGLAYARLSILDLSPAGYQPMVSASGRYIIVFNGEIYNHLTIRADLEREKQWPGWRGHSDTETLLSAIEAWGIEATIKKTVGMFAFSVWDKQSLTLTLARDRVGEKPLYYGWQGNTFLFGSELKALKEHPDFKNIIDRNALTNFMYKGYIPAPQSIYKGIYKLLPGTLLSLKAGEHSVPIPVQYWSFLDVASKGIQMPFVGSDEEAIVGLETRLSEAVLSQQISDVPIGVFLSGGIDSSLITALMQVQSRRPINTFTIGFQEKQYNEAIFAKSIARHLGTNHFELYLSMKEAQSIIPQLTTIYDEPFADASQIPTILLSQFAKSIVTVSLTGDAGDELFAGYNRYFWINKILRINSLIRKFITVGISMQTPLKWNRANDFFQTFIPNALRIGTIGDKAYKILPLLNMNSEEVIYNQILTVWTNKEELVLGDHEISSESIKWNTLAAFGSPINKSMILDSLTYLPDDILCKLDRAGMSVSLETRVPFLDHRVVEYAWQLPLHMKIRDGQSKWILRQLLYKHIPKKLVNRPKMGFSVPIDAWLRGPLKEWAEELINETRLHQEGYLNSALIQLKWKEHLSGKRNWQYQLWNVLMFQEWLANQNRKSQDYL